MGTRVRATAGLAVAFVFILVGCSATSEEETARAELASIVDESIVRFEESGGSETTSVGKSHYAMIFDPTAPLGKQVVTADLALATSPAFGETSEIAIRSMRDLLDSSAFAASKVEGLGDVFTVTGDAFSVEIRARDGLVTQIRLSAAAGGSQVILMTYGITPEARGIFDSAK